MSRTVYLTRLHRAASPGPLTGHLAAASKIASPPPPPLPTGPSACTAASRASSDGFVGRAGPRRDYRAESRPDPACVPSAVISTRLTPSSSATAAASSSPFVLPQP